MRSSLADQDIILSAILNILWREWKLIAFTTFLLACTAALFAIEQPNVYRSEALLEPSDEYQGGGLSAVAGQLGGIASLAGLDLSSNKGKVTAAIETIKSRKFIRIFIEKHQLLVPMFGVSGWDSTANEYIFDSSAYDPETKEWIREAEPPKTSKPSNEEAYQKFISLLNIKEDKQSGLVRISFDHLSPQLAQHTVENIMSDINSYIRKKDVSQAERSITYLENKIEDISISEMRQVFFKLVEEQSKTKMLAEVRDEYVFKTIDPPYLPEEPYSPNRLMIIIGGFLIGLILSCGYVLIRFYYSK